MAELIFLGNVYRANTYTESEWNLISISLSHFKIL